MTPEGTLVFSGSPPLSPQLKGISWPTLHPGRFTGLGSHTEVPLPHIPPLALYSGEVVPTWGLSLLGCLHLATVPWQRSRT